MWFALGCWSPRGGDPFQDATTAPRQGEEGGGSELHRVRFQVSCGGCNVNWSVGFDSGSASESDLFSQVVSVRLFRNETTPARVFAIPDRGGADVRWVRILVDGEVVAEAEASPGGTGELGVEAIIPVEPGGEEQRGRRGG